MAVGEGSESNAHRLRRFESETKRPRGIESALWRPFRRVRREAGREEEEARVNGGPLERTERPECIRDGGREDGQSCEASEEERPSKRGANGTQRRERRAGSTRETKRHRRGGRERAYRQSDGEQS